MRHIAHRIGCGLLAAAILTFTFCGQVRAAGDGQLAPIAVVAFKSVDAVSQFGKQLNLPFPISTSMAEMQVPFMPKGAMASDRPLGVVYLGGPSAGPPEARAYVVPVKPGTATLESLKANDGGEAVPGHPDTVTARAMVLRRVGDYLIVGFKPEVTSLVKVESVTDLVKGQDQLLRAVVDVKTIRTVMPDQFNQLVQAAEGGAASAPGANASTAAGARAVTDAFRKLDRLELALDHGAAGLRLALTAAPVKLPEGAAGKLPDLPANCVARVDVSGAVMQSIPNDPGWADALMDQVEKDEKAKNPNAAPVTPEQKRRMVTILTQVRGLLLGDGGVSVGVEFLANSPVLYVAERYAKPVDLATQLPQLVGQANALAAERKEEKPLDLQSYTIGPTKIFRAVALENGKPVGYVDAAQRGDVVLLAVTDKPFRCIDRLIDARGAAGGPGAPAAGAGRELMSGWIDLGALGTVASKTPGSPLAGMPDEQRRQVLNLLQGQRVRLSATAQGDAGTFDITLPASLLQNVAKLIQSMGGGEQGGPGAGAGPAGGIESK